MHTKRYRSIKRHALTYLVYRIPMTIKEASIYRNGNSYYMCPRCHITLEREFSVFCDRCGQRLNWSHYKNIQHIYIK